MSLTIFCEKGHKTVYKEISIIPTAVTRGIKERYADTVNYWKCPNCKSRVLFDPVTLEPAAEARVD